MPKQTFPFRYLNTILRKLRHLLHFVITELHLQGTLVRYANASNEQQTALSTADKNPAIQTSSPKWLYLLPSTKLHKIQKSPQQ